MSSYKLIVFVAFVAIATAKPQYHHLSPAYHHAVPIEHPTQTAEPEAPVQYNFGYSVHDPQTHDVKEQSETRQGNNVQGHYSLVEPDGTRRIVHYTADEQNGFNAVVQREGNAAHPTTPVQPATPIAAPVVHSVPVFHQATPLVNNAAPVAAYHNAPAFNHATPVAVPNVPINQPAPNYVAPYPSTPVSSVNYFSHGHNNHH